MRVLHLAESDSHTRDPFDLATQAQRVAQEQEGEGVETKVARLHRRWRFDPFAVMKLRREVRAFGPDVVHAWDAVAAAYASFLTTDRLVVTIDDAPSDPTGIESWLHRRSLARASSVIATTPHLSRDADGERARTVAADRIIIPCALTPAPVTDEKRSALFAELDLPANARLIVAAGRLEPAAGMKELIWIADLVRVMHEDMRLVIVGDGPELPVLERFARMASDTEHIRLVGPRDDAAQIIAAAEIFWHAGAELSPHPALLTALATGTPVIADDSPGAKAAIVDNENGLIVKPRDRAARARATDRLLTDAALRERLAAKGREKAAEDFGVAVVANACLETYRKVTS